MVNIMSDPETQVPIKTGTSEPLLKKEVHDELYSEEPICMNVGVTFMPFMEDEYHFLKEENLNSEDGLNEIETTFVKYLYKIRKCNRTNEKIEYELISSPNSLTLRNRVFIGGKIFPDIAIFYSREFSGIGGIGKENANCSSEKFKLKNKTNLYKNYPSYTKTAEKNKKEYFEKFNDLYLSIDNDKISILVPKTTMGINYLSILVDFLKNGETTKISVHNGEFPDIETYTLATGNVNLQKGCWLKKDRIKKNDTWKNACMYLVEHKYQGVLAPFGQIADFYKLLDDKITKETKHKTRWLKGAFKLVKSLDRWLEGQTVLNTSIDNNVEIILNELNVGICDYAITQFYDLFYGKYKENQLDTEQKAYNWDFAFVRHEQGVVAVPIYAKTTASTIKKYQAMADQNGFIGYLSGKAEATIPQFDDPWNGKVTESSFRIDLPMLMLWLDRHVPTSKHFNGKVYTKDTDVIVDGKKQKHKKGTLLEEYRKIIRKYEAK